MKEIFCGKKKGKVCFIKKNDMMIRQIRFAAFVLRDQTFRPIILSF
jgi:hypothetical protein